MAKKEQNAECCENLMIYEQVRNVPEEALKPIQAGRLKGKSDINPMWRIKTLTEMFGPCGYGWRYEIVKMWTEQGTPTEVSAFVQINMYVKYKGEWSEPIVGLGGSSFVTQEKNGAYVSDECYKMALTDAISVSCKALGIAADVYCNSDRTKYDLNQEKENNKNNAPASTVPTPAPLYTGAELSAAVESMMAAKSREEVVKVWKANVKLQNVKEFKSACVEMSKIYPKQ